MHGLVPVINMPMHDVSKLKTVFTNASEHAGFDYETVKINEADVMRWTLNNSAVQVVLATTVTSAVLTLAMPQDDENTIKERLAQSPVANPITQTVQAIGQQYDYTDDMVSLFSFEQLVKGLYKADDSTLSKDIARYVPATIYDEYFGMTSEAAVCKDDVIGLISAAPRMVMGYHDISFSEQALSTKAHGVWELTSPVVKKALQQMQGVMAAHTTEFNDQIFSLGLAWDMSQLASASTTLWQAFLDNKFTCEPLQQAQEELKQVSPMMLGMVTGFAQDLKGVGLSLYDLVFDPNFTVQPSFDVALTVEAENPSNLLSLLQMMPETAHITVPNDGSVVPIDLGLPFDLQMQATIQGQHLVFFSGEKGTLIAQTIGSETLKANALGGGGVFNYKKLADVIDKNDLASLGGSSEVCMETYAFIDQMQNLDMDIASHGKASNHGYEFTMNTVMRKPFKTAHAIDVTGTWQAAYLDETCQWVDVGIETLEPNGTGAYVELSEGGECELYKTAYDWTQQGATIVMKDSESAVSRDNCAQEWIEEGGEATFICEMMQVKTDSFMCIYHGDGEDPFVYRYSR
jgi:hypothetical protein